MGTTGVVRTAGGVACAGVALAAMAVAWVSGPSELDAEDAREATRRSLEHLGFEEIEVDEDAPAGTYESSGGDRIEVWQTAASVEGGRIDLFVSRDDGVGVYLRDRTSDGTGHLLSDEQYTELRRIDENPARDRHRTEAMWATGAAAAVVLAAAALAAARRPD